MSTLYTADVNILTTWRCHVACYRENMTYYRENVNRVIEKKKKKVGFRKTTLGKALVNDKNKKYG